MLSDKVLDRLRARLPKLSACRGESCVPMWRGLGLEAVDAIAEDPRFQSSDAIRRRPDKRHSHLKPQASPVKVEVYVGLALCRQQPLDQARPEGSVANLCGGSGLGRRA